MSRAPASSRSASTALAVYAVVGGLQWGLFRAGWPGLFPSIFLVALGCFLIALAQPGWEQLHRSANPTYPRRRRLALQVMFAPVSVGVMIFVGYLAWMELRAGSGQAYLASLVPEPGSAARTQLIRTVLLSAASAFLLYFLRHALTPAATAATHSNSAGNAASSVPPAQATAPAPRRADPRGAFTLLMLLLVAQALVGALRLAVPTWDFGRVAGVVTAAIALYLVIEWALAWALRLLQPPAQRREKAFSGYSLTLSLLGGRSPVQILAIAIKDSFGLEIRGSWLARYARFCVEPLLLVLVLAGWLSTALVLVPADSEGVRVTWGRFQATTLGPGLHLIAPWPMEQVRIVPARRVQEFALGFENDLGGPVLWTEQHFSGESNLLVGNGEEVLTFNVPILYDLSDALAVERTSVAPGRLLANLAQRELLLATAPRESFGIMTTDRGVVSDQISRQLQVAADRLGLGARIRYVGLKDIHPPVDVAPAYQEVISAREQRRMMIDLAAANRITGLADARTEAYRARRQAESFAAERVAAVTGEGFILTGKVDARRIDPELFDFRNRLLVAEEVIPNLRLILTDMRKVQEPTTMIDLREGAKSTP